MHKDELQWCDIISCRGNKMRITERPTRWGKYGIVDVVIDEDTQPQQILSSMAAGYPKSICELVYLADGSRRVLRHNFSMCINCQYIPAKRYLEAHDA